MTRYLIVKGQVEKTGYQMTLITLKDLETHLWHAAHIITGPIDASDYKTYIFPILFFKRICDVYDEEFTEALAQVGDAELAKGDMFHRINPYLTQPA